MKKAKLLCFISIIFPVFAFTEIEIRNISPPKLESVNIGKKMVVSVPMRAKTPNMSVEKIGNKVVAHNYGHGIMAWSLAPGAATYVNSLLVNFSSEIKNNVDTPITVIGGGVIGLFSAYNLHQRGFTDITVIAQSLDNLPSQNTSGLVHFVTLSDDHELQKNIEQIAVESYKFYKFVSKKKYSIFRYCIMMVPAYFDSKEKSGLELYVGTTIMPAKDVIVNFGNGIKRKMIVYDDAVFVNVEQVMDELLYYLRSHNVKFLTGTVKDFSAVKSNFIVNCSGIGAKRLADDSAMTEIREYVIALKKQNPRNLHYMMFITSNNTRFHFGRTVKHSLYILPKTSFVADSERSNGIIGGTIIGSEGMHFSDGEEFNIIIQGAKNLYAERAKNLYGDQ